MLAKILELHLGDAISHHLKAAYNSLSMREPYRFAGADQHSKHITLSYKQLKRVPEALLQWSQKDSIINEKQICELPLHLEILSIKNTSRDESQP